MEKILFTITFIALTFSSNITFSKQLLGRLVAESYDEEEYERQDLSNLEKYELNSRRAASEYSEGYTAGQRAVQENIVRANDNLKERPLCKQWLDQCIEDAGCYPGDRVAPAIGEWIVTFGYCFGVNGTCVMTTELMRLRGVCTETSK